MNSTTMLTKSSLTVPDTLYADKLVVSLLTAGGKIEETFDLRKEKSGHGRESNSNNWIILLE